MSYPHIHKFIDRYSNGCHSLLSDEVREPRPIVRAFWNMRGAFRRLVGSRPPQILLPPSVSSIDLRMAFERISFDEARQREAESREQWIRLVESGWKCGCLSGR